MTATATVDAHHHYWRTAEQEQPWRQPEHDGVLARDFEPADLAEHLAANAVDATVLVESVDEPAENHRLLRYAAQTPTVAGVVGWLPLTDAERGRSELEFLAGHPEVRGVRFLVGRDPLDWLTGREPLDLLRALADRGLCWDIVVVNDAQAERVLNVAWALPHLRIVVDHLARPPLETGGWKPWARRIARLGTLPSIALKVSVGIDALSAWPRWSGTELVRYVGWAVECFGPDRLMVASNWPVVLLRAAYDVAWSDQLDALAQAGLDEDELAEVRGGTAIRWYGLPVDAAG